MPRDSWLATSKQNQPSLDPCHFAGLCEQIQYDALPAAKHQARNKHTNSKALIATQRLWGWLSRDMHRAHLLAVLSHAVVVPRVISNLMNGQSSARCQRQQRLGAETNGYTLHSSKKHDRLRLRLGRSC